MSAMMRYSFLIVIALALLTAQNALANNSRSPRNNDISNMADALKYLQDLDTYYGDRARARFGKRSPLLQLLQQHSLENTEQHRELAHCRDESGKSPDFLDSNECQTQRNTPIWCLFFQDILLTKHSLDTGQ
ncbi:neuropeptide F-like [Anastrepha obliqua]|uniref:neuropeptide F-like n=1 Tax=Anastrepha obliqua TaxID=95512 RepID=UPI0024092F23|nr:neuropeptide F-like [Anastrepha obliqua]